MLLVGLVVLALLTVALIIDPMLVAAAEATLAPGELLETGDPRSEGTGPGLVGNPLLILVGVVVLGVATAVATLVIARLARRP